MQDDENRDQTMVAPSCEQLIDVIPNPFVVIDRNYRIVAANRAYQRQYGVGAEGVVGRTCHKVSHHSDVPCSQHGEHCPLEEVFRSGQPVQVMHIHFDQQNREEHVQLQAAPILGEDGGVLYMGEFMQVVKSHDDDETLLVGRSPQLLRMTSLLQRVAPTRTIVLLEGESGTGKEKVAEYIHHFSDRRAQPFVVVDCGTLGEQLIESELFGHEKGAFTGASSRKLGLFERAHGGTLLIDEIGELPLALQTKLLRALEGGAIRRIGGTEYRQIDVRVIAATNRDLRARVAEGEFREDLYYRLSAFPVKLPPLRDRKDDIPLLAEHLLAQMPEGELNLPLAPEVIEALLHHDYPGNIRELRNILERAHVLACGGTLTADHIVIEPAMDIAQPRPAGGAVAHQGRRRRHGMPPEEAIQQALDQCGGHRGQAATWLGVSERTLYRYLRSLDQGEETPGRSG